MRNLIFSLFAIAVAAVAAMTATTAMLNTPQRPGIATATDAPVPHSLAQAEPPAGGTPAPAGAGTPAPASTGNAEGAAAPADPKADTAEEADKDPYEGVAEEELPPDLQYSADSSVSFPTNI